MTTQLITMHPAPYLAFTADTTEDEARARFLARFGIEPEQVGRLYPGREVYAGPQPKQNADDQ